MSQPLHIVLFAHPQFMRSQSMPRFAHMLQGSFVARGCTVELWAPRPLVYRCVPEGPLSKWAGYVDQYLLFPLWVMWQSGRQPKGTLYVFSDQALGPWVPRVRHKPHVVHVHDLLALRSALGEVPENRTGWSGRLYQRYIRRGFRQARHFISVSYRTQSDLHRYGQPEALSSHVVYNGLNYPFVPLPDKEAMQALQRAGLPVPAHGMLLHVSGNQWYKNVAGVIRIYAHYASCHPNPLPLWLVGDMGAHHFAEAMAAVPAQGQVLFFKGLDTPVLQACYSMARVFLFPSLAEGFGWPLAEAQACGCPVITTDEPPMNEVAGPHASYLPRLQPQDDADAWAAEGAQVLQQLLDLNDADTRTLRARCAAWPVRFDADAAIDSYLAIYRDVLAGGKSLSTPTGIEI